MPTSHETAHETASNAGQAPKRVLVIDDNKDAADSIRMLLEMEGHSACCAYDGKDGLELARSFRPELVLVDIGLPGMTGYEVARCFRKQQPVPDCKLVAITGYAYLERHIAAAGFDGYKLKPVSYEHLQEFLS